MVVDVMLCLGHHVPPCDVGHVAASVLQCCLGHIDDQVQDRQARDRVPGFWTKTRVGERTDHGLDDPGRLQLHTDQ